MKKINKVLLGLTFIATTCLLTSCKYTAIRAGFDYEVTGEKISREYTFETLNKLDIRYIHTRQKTTYRGVDLEIKASEEKKVVVEMAESLFDVITINSQDETLNIRGVNKYNYVTDSIKISVYGYEFTDIDLSTVSGSIEGTTLKNDATITLSGACDLAFTDINVDKLNFKASGASNSTFNKLFADELDLDISGASDITFEQINTTKIDALISGASTVILKNTTSENDKFNISGASKIKLEGSSTTGKLTESGASRFEGKNYTFTSIDINVSGASNADIYATGDITGSTSGASNVNVYGNTKSYIFYSGASKVVYKG